MLKKLVSKYHAIPVPAKAAMWFAICSVITNCISMITMPLFTRLMSTEQYGVYSIYNTWLQMFTVVATLRLNYAVFNKGMNKYPDDRDSYAASMQTLTTIIVGICVALYLPFSQFVNELTGLSTLITLLIFVEIIFASAISYWMARRRYEYGFRSVIVTTIIVAVGNASLGVAAVLLFEQKDIARIASCVLIQCIVGSVIYAVNIRRSRKTFCWEYVKFALIFNMPLLPHYAAMYVLDAFDRIMIQAMVGFSAAALYSVACSIGNVLKIITNSINNAIVPWMYDKLGAKEYRELGAISIAVIVLPAIPVLLLIAIGPEIIWLFGGGQYAEAQYVIPPIAESLVFSFAYTVFTNIEFYFDRNKFVMVVSVGASILNVILNLFLIEAFGFIAAAYTTLGCYFLMAVAHYVYMKHIFTSMEVDCPFNGAKLAGLAMALVGGGIGLTLLYQLPLVRIGILVIAIATMVACRKRLLCLINTVRRKRT